MIKSYSEIQNTLKNYGVDNWAKSAQIQNRFGLEGMVPLEEGTGSTQSFGQMLMDSMTKVNEIQKSADVAMQKLASGESSNLHETLLQVEKAEIAFKTMNQVRTKVLDAYREIMKMQI